MSSKQRRCAATTIGTFAGELELALLNESAGARKRAGLAGARGTPGRL